MSDPAAADGEELEAFAGAVAGYKAGEFVALMIHLGDRLGLYKALAGAGPHSAAELAQTTGLHERWLLEWLRGQAAAKLLAYRGDDRFELTPAGATVLVQGDSPQCMVGLFAAPPTPTPVVDRVAEAFRTGLGMTFDDHGPDVAHMGARLTRAVHEMLPSVLDPLDAGPRLQRGARVVDVG